MQEPAITPELVQKHNLSVPVAYDKDTGCQIAVSDFSLCTKDPIWTPVQTNSGTGGLITFTRPTPLSRVPLDRVRIGGAAEHPCTSGNARWETPRVEGAVAPSEVSRTNLVLDAGRWQRHVDTNPFTVLTMKTGKSVAQEFWTEDDKRL